MKLISHRGNIAGKNFELENRPDYISNAIKLGYDCEIDVWLIKNKIYLGHDKNKRKMYEVKINFLKKGQYLEPSGMRVLQLIPIIITYI